ncbi:hypothetical protein TNCV_1892861 [Trichonephila clavipes]|nr:hypothetical protein TNCV_1892861 [Trichonephila clavipes]
MLPTINSLNLLVELCNALMSSVSVLRQATSASNNSNNGTTDVSIMVWLSGYPDMSLKMGCDLKVCPCTKSGMTTASQFMEARRTFVEWAQNEIAVVPDFHKRILFSDEAHFWLNGYVNKQNCRICSEANPQVYVETPLHPEKLTVWCALWAGGILLQKR